MAEKFSLKDHLFNQTKVEYLATLLGKGSKTFPEQIFIDQVMEKLLTLELKDRIRHITRVLHNVLPKNYRKAVAIIIASLPPPLDPTRTDDDFGQFIFAPFGEYVAQYGCTKEHLKCSLAALEELTMRFSMEDSIRYFLRTFPDETLAQCHKWVMHENYHVRRLVSEGTRPLLPWSGRVGISATDTLPLLTALHTDSTRYVTRSIANHLNDISKQNPDLVIHILEEWRIAGQAAEKELEWMTKHALRTLIKAGYPGALRLLGYQETNVTIGDFTVTPQKINAGERITLHARVEAKPGTRLLVDYIIHFVKKNGTTAPKVFKWKMCIVPDSREVVLTKPHHLKADATTFTLYPGEHHIALQINGQIVGQTKFIIKM